MACYIIGAGEFFGFETRPSESDFVIAADGGLAICRQEHVEPQVILGDFDSLGYVPSEDNVMQVPVEKNDTDMMLAVKLGLSKGEREFHIYGGTGGRLDHTVANLQTLAYLAKERCRGWLYDRMGKFTAIQNGELSLPARGEGIFSVFAMGGDAVGVTITGGQYSAQGLTLRGNMPRGVSNHFVGREVTVEVKEGTLLIGVLEE